MAGDTRTWSQSLLRRLLFTRNAKPAVTFQQDGGSVTRRNVLVGIGVTASVSAIAADEPKVEWGGPTGRALFVSYKNEVWRLDGTAFSPTTSIAWKQNVAGVRHHIAMASAVFPGLDLDVSFEAHIYSRGHGWFISLAFPRLGKTLELELSAWITGRVPYIGTLPGYERIHVIDDQQRLTFQLPTGQRRIELTSNFKALVTASKLIAVDTGRLKAKLGKLEIVLQQKPVLNENAQAASWFSAVTAGDILTDKARLSLGAIESHGAASLHAVLDVDAVESLQIEAYLAKHKLALRQARISVRGEGDLGVQRPAKGTVDSRIQLSRWLLTGDVRHFARRMVVSAALQHTDQGFQTDHMSLCFGPETTTAEAYFATIMVVKDKPIPPLVFRGLLRQANVPVRGASAAEVSFSQRPLVLQFGGSPPPTEITTDCIARLVVTPGGDTFNCALEGATLRLARGSDTFGLKFQFLHYALRVRAGRTDLIQRWSFGAGCQLPKDTKDPTSGKFDHTNPRLYVVFPPQCEGEEVFEAPESKKANGAGAAAIATPAVAPPTVTPPAAATSCPAPNTGDCRPAEEPVPRPLGKDVMYPDLARTRIADETRLVFVDTEAGVRSPKRITGEIVSEAELTIESLTDWRDLSLAVSERALPRNAGLEQQLAAVKITPEMSRIKAREKIRDSITQDWGDGSSLRDDLTSIEAMYRLIVSPDKDARFDTPRLAPDRGWPRVWMADLRQNAGVAVRALTARGIDLKFLEVGGGYDVPEWERNSFARSTTNHDHVQLMGQMSVYGLGALRRLVEKNPSLGSNVEYSDDPNGSVFLPADTYRYLNPPKDGKLAQEGVALARPFERFKLRLGRFADVDAFWQGEPPAGDELGKDGAFFKPAFSLERYTHLVGQGRDAFVELIYKGFLFPLGHRAAYLKVTTREFHPYLDQPRGGPTGYLIQRHYIVCRKPEKAFPAYEQPYGSRDFPARRVNILSPLTEIKRPENIDLNQPSICAPCKPDVNAVFWPRYPSSATNGAPLVHFEIGIDGSPNTARVPLIFVDNAAVHAPESMRKLVELYNSLTAAIVSPPANADQQKIIQSIKDAGATLQLKSEDEGRAAIALMHTPGKRRYGEELKPGDLSYATAEWRLAARGRLQPQKPSPTPGAPGAQVEEFFAMDAYMEGRDQPPFYPVVETALISVEQIDRLTQRDHQPITVAFNGQYVRQAFDPRYNAGEVVLDVIKPALHMNGERSGGATGGLAAGNALIAGLSRKVGPVGGRPTDAAGAKLLAANRNVTARSISNVERRFDMTSSLDGRFSPKEFFGGALKQATLLGVVALSDIVLDKLIERAPKIVEDAEYMVRQIEELRNIIAKAAADVHAAIKKVREDVEGAILDLKTPGLSLQSLYPELEKALSDLESAAKSAAAQLADESVAVTALGAPIKHFKSTADALIDVVVRISRDPVPSVIKQVIVDILSAWTTLRGVLDGDGPRKLIEALVNDLLRRNGNALYETICARAIDEGSFQALFGTIDSGGDNQAAQRAVCMDLLRSPADVLPRLRSALFNKVLSSTIVRGVELAKSIELLTTGIAYVEVARLELNTRFVAALRMGASEFDDPLLHAIATDLVAVVVAETAGGDVVKLADPVVVHAIGEKLEVAFRSRIPSLKTRLESRLSGIDQAIKKLEAELEVKKGEMTQKVQLAYDALMTERARLQSLQREINVILAAIGKPPEFAGLRGILKSALDAAIASAVERARVLATSAAKAKLDGVAEKLGDFVLGQFDTFVQLNDLVEFQQTIRTAILDNGVPKAEKLCQAVTDFAAAGVNSLTGDLEQDVLPKIRKIVATLSDTALNIDKLRLPDKTSDAVRIHLASLSASMRRTATSVSTLFAELQAAQVKSDAAIKNVKGNCKPGVEIAGLGLAALLDPVAMAVDMRRQIVETIAGLFAELASAIDTVGSAKTITAASVGTMSTSSFAGARARIAVADLDQLSKDLTSLVLMIFGLAKEIVLGVSDRALKLGGWSQVESQIKAIGISDEVKFKVKVKEVSDKAKYLRGRIEGLKDDFDIKDLRSLLAEIVVHTIASDQEFIARLMQAALFASKLVDEAEKSAFGIVGSVATPLVAVYEKVSAALGNIRTTLKAITDSAPVLSMLAPGTIERLKWAQDKVDLDLKRLRDIHDKAGSADSTVRKVAANAVRGLIEAWKEDRPGLILATMTVRQIVDPILHGKIGELIDPEAIRAMIEDAVKDIVPTRIKLNYDFDAELDDYPKSGPIFAMDRGMYDSEGYEILTPEKKAPSNDLVIRTIVDFDLIDRTTVARAEGYLRPFKIRLLGSSLDLITLRFKGAAFSIEPGQSPSLKADVGGYEIGPMLSFLSALGPLGKPKGENGFYYFLDFMPMQISVGYAYVAGQPIRVGTLTLSNLALDIGALLPLDGRQAIFQFIFAKRSLPFLISQPPYGGGGFFALKANARGIVSFEIQLEFGAVVDFSFGPLTGFGSITAGIYLFSGEGRRALEGFVHAIGNASIAIFSLSVFMEIKVRQQDDSSMEGSATFVFSFSTGLIDFNYSVTASHRQEGGDGGTASGSEPAGKRSLQRQAALEGSGSLMLLAGSAASGLPPQISSGPKGGTGASALLRKEENWSTYKKFIDLADL